MKKRNILIFSPSEWSDNAVSNMQIAAELSKKNKVVYFETVGGRLPSFSEIPRVIRRIFRFFSSIKPGKSANGLETEQVIIISPLAIPYHSSSFIDWVNRALLRFQIDRVLSKHKINKPIVWNFSPNWTNAIAYLKDSTRIFHCVDALETYDQSEKFKKKLEITIKHAHVVFTPNQGLKDRLIEFNSLTKLVGHGYGKQHLEFSKKILPARFPKNRSTMRIVYAGSLASWVDFDLLIYITEKLQHIDFDFIGNKHISTPLEKISKLEQMPNTRFHGYINYRDLPEMYGKADLGIVPYQRNNLHIQASTPTKFLDYLAAGLPVVTTNFPSAHQMLPYVSIADTFEEFYNAIEENLQRDTAELAAKRHSFVEIMSWENQIRLMTDEIEILEKNLGLNCHDLNTPPIKNV